MYLSVPIPHAMERQLCKYIIKYIFLAFKAPKNRNSEFTNSIDPGEVAHNEPPHLDLCCSSSKPPHLDLCCSPSNLRTFDLKEF